MVEVGPLVSVIVPVYNVAQYLEKCVESIVNQTYTNLQIIIINDGSTDNSGELCNGYARIDNRIEVYHTKNRGLVAARREGLKHVRGEYVGFVDGDDYIEPDMFEQLLQNVVETGADFVHTGYLEEKEGMITRVVADIPKEVLVLETEEDHISAIRDFVLEKKEGYHIVPGTCFKLFKTDFIKDCYMGVPDEQQYGEDVLCLYHALIRGRKISLMPVALYHYNVHEKSLSHTDAQKRLMNEISLTHYIIKLLNDYGYMCQMQEIFSCYINRRMMRLTEENTQGGLQIPKFYHESLKYLNGKKIVLYGAGKVGEDYYAQICKYRNCDIVAWTDQKWETIYPEYAEVIEPLAAVKMEYDMVLIAIENEKTAKSIKDYLQEIGVAEEKIVWEEPMKY